MFIVFIILTVIVLYILTVLHLINSQSLVVFSKKTNDNKKTVQKHIRTHLPTTYHTIITPKIQQMLNDNKSDMRVGRYFYQTMLDIAKQQANSSLALVYDDNGWIT